MNKLEKIMRKATYSVYELLVELWDKVNDIVDGLGGKTDINGDHKGTWQGLRPSQANESISSLVDTHTTQLEQNIQRWDELSIVSPLDFGCVGDGIVDDTTNFEITLDYCIANKKPLFLTPNYNFAISSIFKQIPSNQGFTMFGRGKESKITITNTNNLNGLSFGVGGILRDVTIKDFMIIGNNQCKNGLHVINAMNPCEISGIVGQNFYNVGSSVVEVQDCIAILISNITGRGNTRCVTLRGQCNLTHVDYVSGVDYTEWNIGIVPDFVEKTGLLQNSVGVSIIEPNCYGNGGVGTIGVYAEDATSMTIIGGWFERVEKAIYGKKGLTSEGVIRCTIINPVRGGTPTQHIYLENADDSHIISPSIAVHLDSQTLGANVEVIALSSCIEETVGNNNIKGKDGYIIIPNVEFKGGIGEVIADGMSTQSPYIANGSDFTFTPKANVANMIIHCTSLACSGLFSYRAASNPINVKIGGSNNITNVYGTTASLNVRVNSDGTITIQNKLGASKSFRISVI